MRLLFGKKESQDAGKTPAAEQRPYHEFIPYYAHYDDHTLLTKNGELMQVIRIDSNTLGLNYESGENADETVRAVVRRALAEAIATDDYAVCVHTLRKRRAVQYASDYSNPFAAHIYKSWQEKHRWRHQYYNEIYISILHEGQGAKLFDPQNIGNAFSPRRNRDVRNSYLDQSHKKLDAVVADLMQRIAVRYRSRRLAIVERVPEKNSSLRGIFYSEPLEFLNTLINLRDEEIPITDVDVGQMLSPQTLLVGFNALETKDAAGVRRFGAILTLKQYRELPPETADRILQLPTELIVSQSFDFIPEDEALAEYKEQKWLFGVSGDDYSETASGLAEMLAQNRKHPTDYSEQQTTIMVVVDEYRQLDTEIRQLQEALSEIGLITIREDIRLEECYWASLPGNFEFIRRAEPVPTSRVAGLCRLNRFPQGSETNLHWNHPLALVPTSVNSPYFFNFHYQDNGHTALLDFNSFGDTTAVVTLDFLLSMSLKFGGHIYVFDRHQRSRLFASKLGASYRRPVLKKQPAIRDPLRLNPFVLEGNRLNLSFLLAWCASLAPADAPLSDMQRETLRQAIDQLYTLPPGDRNLPKLTALAVQADPSLMSLFAPFCGEGAYAGLFDHAADTLALPDIFAAFDMDLAATQPRLAIPLMSYLMHRIIDSLDGKPTIIVLHDALTLLENPFFAPRLESLMEMLAQNNALLVAMLPNPQQAEGSKTLTTLMQGCATRLYVPDDVTQDYVSPALGLNENDGRMLSRMQRAMGDVLVKQRPETVGLRINLDHAEDVKAIFSNDIKNLIAAGGKFATLPKDD